jgi:hypothetical protein
MNPGSKSETCEQPLDDDCVTDFSARGVWLFESPAGWTDVLQVNKVF